MREGTNFKGSHSGRCSFPICVYDHNTVFLLLWCFCVLMLVTMLGEALAMSGRDPASSDKSCVEQNHRAVSHAKNRTSQTSDSDNMFVSLRSIGDSIP